MAQTNFTPISLYYSATAAAVPTAGNLVAGELAINTADGKLFYKDSAGVVQVIGTKGGVGSSTTTQVLYNSSGLVVGSANLTFNGTTLTAGGLTTTGATSTGTFSATGVATFSAGTVSAPAITTTGDTNTGIFFPAADTIAFTEGGVESMRIDSSGNLGLGTSSPGERMVVAGGCLQVTGNLSSVNRPSSAIMDFFSGNTRFFSIGADSATSGGFSFRTSTTTSSIEAMRLDSSGNLGLGVTPSAWGGNGKPLQTGNASFWGLVGTATFSSVGANYFYDGSYKYISTAAATDYYQLSGSHVWRTAASGTAGNAITFTESMRITSTGNVGIGTSSPAYRLDVRDGVDTTFTNNPINTVLSNNGTIAAGLGAGIAFAANFNGSSLTTYAAISGIRENATSGSSLGALVLGTRRASGASMEAMRIDSSGNVGIGTSSPSARLNVVGTGANPTVEIAGNSAITGASSPAFLRLSNLHNSIGAGDSIGEIQFYSSDASGGGAGVSSFVKGIQEVTSPNNGALTFGTGSTTASERMRIDSSGNVGIGTSPSDTYGFSRALDINGTSGAIIYLRTNGSTTNTSAIGNSGTDLYIKNNAAGNIRFFNNGENTERMRIDSSGNVLVGTTSTALTTAGIKFSVYSATSANISLGDAATANTDIRYTLYSTGAAAYRFYVGMGGTIYATSTTITAISDARLKENIQDIDVGLDKVMALKPRKFDWKAGKGKDKKGDRGWIAQEFEQVFPEMIDTWQDPAPEGEEPYKAVNADLIPVLVKAIQEQQALIENLTTRLNALEGK